MLFDGFALVWEMLSAWMLVCRAGVTSSFSWFGGARMACRGAALSKFLKCALDRSMHKDDFQFGVLGF
jgi:hypothetical protein